MRYFLMFFLVAVVVVVGVAGFRGQSSRRPPIELFPDMDRQPKLRPQAPNAFFADGRSSQLQVTGTVARGTAYADTPVNTGREAGTTNWIPVNPLPITAALLQRGRERYNISCLPCHGPVGDGKGIVTRYGMIGVANFHEPTGKFVQMTDGEIFHTITYGKNLMGPYGPQIAINDRWAIVAYVRALQRSRLASRDEVPEASRGVLNPPPPK